MILVHLGCIVSFLLISPYMKSVLILIFVLDKVSIPLESSVISVTINESPSSNGRNWKRKLIGAGEFDIEKPSIATRLEHLYSCNCF